MKKILPHQLFTLALLACLSLSGAVLAETAGAPLVEPAPAIPVPTMAAPVAAQAVINAPIMAQSVVASPQIAKNKINSPTIESTSGMALSLQRDVKKTDKSTALSDAEASKQQVQILSDALLAVMQQATELGFEGRLAKLSPVLAQAYNFPLMTRLATGPLWRMASAEEQARLIKAFAQFSQATYASRFSGYGGEKFVVKQASQAAGGGMMVETLLVKANGQPIQLNYLMRQDEKQKWRIVDVFLDAAISEMATRRAEFSAIARKDGISALIAHLEKKTRALNMPTG